MSTLSIKGVHSDYHGQQVLKGLDLTLKKGEITALLGPSGCGKTTLLRAIAGLQLLSKGEISINKRVLSGPDVFVPSEQRGVGMIFQDYALFPHLNVADNILFGVKSTSKGKRKQRLNEMLSLVKLDGLDKRFPHELSGGQQQRVSIARALAYEPELLLLDEPFSNIDAKVRGEMMLEIRTILKESNVSAVFVTHSKDEAFVFADKLALFKEGQIVQYGTAEELYRSPNDRYVADFLGLSNYLPAVVSSASSIETPLGSFTSTSRLPYPVSYQGEVMLRPQQFEMIANETGDGVIIERRFLGSSCHYQVKVAGSCYQVTSLYEQFVPGQRVSLIISVHSFVIF
ncbi:ABC transporter ATP-binding protein [Shewanella sp. D64]|uniref:ABC transporter ATP-binding protein n=1 Tax=unclassified Shewanella TaxID=196818 RepID=UPI0022BA3D56|nr:MULTISPECIES: ABC transporter ATP-binding protein [unclassified Shewanella]MEC4727256.1 ABC transporter ATP-binding protein [Shewanella sp. D64]MEC4739411.1 ABC transporter ATP-binding protein [Shewanella sp. E94]WBJ96740.1 ABC transporter ATP-binding protein [Shewanella sp. MTB7]